MIGKWLKRKQASPAVSRVAPLVDVDPLERITPTAAMDYGIAPTTATALYPVGGKRGARSRQQIYAKWTQMEADPIVSSAVGLLVTAALGGHETTGQVLFIEPTLAARNDNQMVKLVEEIAQQINPLLDSAAYSLGYTAGVFGDAFVRIYADERGVHSLYTDELVRPPLVQPFERAGETVGYALYTGEKQFERLDTLQLARVKLPRVQWVPQHGVEMKALRYALAEDDVAQAPVMPSAVGGSLLYNAETAYERLLASLAGMTNQRVLDSIQESVYQLNMDTMTKAQQELYVENFTRMMLRSQTLAQELVAKGEFHAGRIVHGIPVYGDKQMLGAGQPLGAPRNSAVSVDDVMLNAKLLAGAFGVDLSMLGFADLLSGGLGEGGFFRVSAQVAERARLLRPALTACFNHILNVHCLKRYGTAFASGDEPWTIGYYSTISALESERQRTAMDAMSAGMTLAQTMQALKDLGLDTATTETFLAKTMLIDDDLAKVYAAGLAQAQPPNVGMGRDDELV